MKDRLKFKNGRFTVLQVSDAQDLQHARHAMLDMLERAYDRLCPDLVVLTGDNILGNHLRDCWFIHKYLVNTKEKEYAAMQTAIKKLVEPIEKRNIPFAMIYGNHDDVNEITKEEQADIYRRYSRCTGLEKDDGRPECATYNIPIYSEDGKSIKYNLWMMDSSWYDKTEKKCHGYVKKEAVEWYKSKSAELKRENGGVPVPSLMFQHIPMRETLELIEQTDKAHASVEFKGGYYKLKDGCSGILGEFPGVTEEFDNGQLEAMKECGNIKAAVFGHDHVNLFTAKLDGIDIIQTSGASMRCYGDRTRGVRLFTLYENGDYETEFYTYNDLCGRGIISQLKYFHDADDLAKARGITAAVIGTAAAGAVLGFALNKK
ncbi:MAG: metallophosphoesterase [Clostridia bacterium]|nr:metallophosphoesterase [Clostridia bacterium]